ncbi:glutathione S-transferase C-terminal domain-containing protein [Methylobacterium sp. Leaf118]|uniref:glutathione S-transferase C-terminal domain-containing protein n=1 Tax=Methylobacterium sp. Leaf118 TaxID=2876562 RepID=UPI001E316FDA|nr:glutathione S-transferase C-terminal domain-containing protein [Methylobacterium sp. Leaf118]
MRSARREDFRKRCDDRGIARFATVESIDKAKRDLRAIDTLIGETRHLLGNERPTSYDAAVFGFTQAFFQPRGMHPAITGFARTLPNLGRPIQTLTTTWYPERTLAFEPAEPVRTRRRVEGARRPWTGRPWTGRSWTRRPCPAGAPISV